MKPTNPMPIRMRERGQTIIIALLVLGVLLVLGLVFLGIIDKSNRTSYNLGNRTLAESLSEAGIRYCHSQLLTSQLGADWRVSPTSLSVTGNTTLDPDVYYLRPPATLANGTPLTIVPGGTQIDLGGPDGLGFYSRINYAGGRVLVRVRYAPSDANIFSSSPTGPLRFPGLMRTFISIDAIGREGVVNTSDPTTLSQTGPIQYRQFNQDVDFRAAFAQMQANENHFPFSQIQRAFVSIPIIETARFISNKYNVSRSADIGIPAELSAVYNGNPVQPNLAYQLGSPQNVFNLGVVPTSAGPVGQGGSIFSNANVVLHGNVMLDLNRYLGDQFDIAGSIAADLPNPSAPGTVGGQLNVILSDVTNTGTWQSNASGYIGEPNIDSTSPNFSTIEGTVRDGNSNPDTVGDPRGVGQKGVPSAEITDPVTGENRYVLITAQSGVQFGNGNDGLFGHGQGVYVSNASDVQGPTDEFGRVIAGSEESLQYDWLNPDNGTPGSGWSGYLYVPPGSVFRGLDDGFTIQRNSQAPQAERDWRYVDGTDTGSSFIRYRLGLGTETPVPQVHILNSYSPLFVSNPGISINSNLTPAQFQSGPVFNGVVYFQGNARVQGIIPTDVQMTLVSDASIYIEGSITKGVTANGLQSGIAAGTLLTRPSKSMLMLIAKDYVTLNTTMFFGPSANQQVEPVHDAPNSNGFSPIRVRTGGSLDMEYSFVRDPNGPFATPNNPSTTRPFEFDYAEAGNTGVKIPTSVVIAHTMDDGPAPATFFTWDVNYGGPAPSPYFFLSANNTAAAYIPGVTQTIPEYGLGTEIDQRYPKFEQTAFTLLDPTTATMSGDGQQMIANGLSGNYSLFTEGINDLLVRQVSISGAPTNDYIIGRMALAPHDIRIEASMYAEEASFFVIPGPWFNPNPNDLRTNYVNGLDVYSGSGSIAEKNEIRFEQFGSWPNMPFYGEPLDVRVVILGSVSENMPPPASVQAQWLQKWGWIPEDLAATGFLIPQSHIPSSPGPNGTAYQVGTGNVVPNLIITYDPALGTDRNMGFVTDNDTATLLRADSYGRALPPMPRLPVSPTLAYFGEVH